MIDLTTRFKTEKSKNSFLKEAEKTARVQAKYQDSEQFMTIIELKEAGIYPYKHVDLDEDAIIVSKLRKDGGTFLVMQFTLVNGATFDLPLSYKHDFKEGDVVEIEDLKLITEEFLDKSHMCVTDGKHIKRDEN